jgi:hypothetical protein
MLTSVQMVLFFLHSLPVIEVVKSKLSSVITVTDLYCDNVDSRILLFCIQPFVHSFQRIRFFTLTVGNGRKAKQTVFPDIFKWFY